MEKDLREQFIERLEERYGDWDKMSSRFGSTSFGVISRDLSISASQFSKLIYGTATEGMYQRSIENIKRLIQRESIRKELEVVKAQNHQLQAQKAQFGQRMKRQLLWIIPGFLLASALGATLMYFLQASPAPPPKAEDKKVAHPLSLYFDQDFNANFNSPFLDITEVQEYCPASAYEGTWSLNKSYKLPLPGSRRPGLYYLAKSADVRMKCSRYDTIGIGKGRVLSAYEFLVNEIWIDTTMTPLTPTYFDREKKVFTQEFEQLEFHNNPQFKKVASIYSFFTDQFEIYPDSIVRKGEPCGRFASDVNEALVAEFELDIKYILNNVLSDLTTTNCRPTANLFCNPNELKEKESALNFDCLYTITTENLGMGGGYPYQKGYQLEKQNYADNLICDCE